MDRGIQCPFPRAIAHSFYHVCIQPYTANDVLNWEVHEVSSEFNTSFAPNVTIYCPLKKLQSAGTPIVLEKPSTYNQTSSLRNTIMKTD